MPDLDSILGELDERCIAEKELRVAMALKEFPVPSATVGSYREMLDLGARFYQHLMGRLHDASVSDSDAHGFVATFFARSFDAGVADAADMATAGVEGGVLGVLRRIADGITKQLTEQHIAAAISAGVDLSDWEDKARLMEDYIARFAPNVPPGDRRKSAMELADKAESLLANHIKIAGYFRKSLGKR